MKDQRKEGFAPQNSETTMDILVNEVNNTCKFKRKVKKATQVSVRKVKKTQIFMECQDQQPELEIQAFPEDKLELDFEHSTSGVHRAMIHDVDDFDLKEYSLNFEIPQNYKGIQRRLKDTIHSVESKFLQDGREDDDENDESFCLDDLDNIDLVKKTFGRIPYFRLYEESKDETEDMKESVGTKNVSETNGKLCNKGTKCSCAEKCPPSEKIDQVLKKVDVLPVGTENKDWYSVLSNSYRQIPLPLKCPTFEYLKKIPTANIKSDAFLKSQQLSKNQRAKRKIPSIKLDTFLESTKISKHQKHKSRSLFEDVKKVKSSSFLDMSKHTPGKVVLRNIFGDAKFPTYVKQ